MTHLGAALDLPEPDAEAAAHSQRLQRLLRTEIAAQGGRIPFARFMELALYAPGLGYYSAGARKFGAGGDFITAPELSPLFARCLARQCQQALQILPDSAIIEVGAGSGIMAADLLCELERLNSLPARYFILELSGELRARQQATLMRHAAHLAGRVVWLDALPRPGFRGVVLANELLDAMPVHLFQVDEDGATELYIACQDDEFIWQRGSLSETGLAQRIAAIEQGWHEQDIELSAPYRSEINLAAESWLRSIGALLTAGLVLIIDYGFPRHEYYHPQRAAGTLMCHYRHRAHTNPLLLPGLQDITAHVDFTAIAEAGCAAGLAVAGYATQAAFLIANGLEKMASDSVATSQRLEQARQIKKLTLPSEMGELFKVIALTRDLPVPLQGFTLQDLRGRL